LKENKVETFMPITVVNWTNEDGARFNTKMLSCGDWVGEVELQKAYDRQDSDRITFKDKL